MLMNLPWDVVALLAACGAAAALLMHARSEPTEFDDTAMEPAWPWPYVEAVPMAEEVFSPSALELPMDSGENLPLQQITIQLQGREDTDPQAVISQLANVMWRLRAGERAGVVHDAEVGYAFEWEVASRRPSFFATTAGGA